MYSPGKDTYSSLGMARSHAHPPGTSRRGGRRAGLLLEALAALPFGILGAGPYGDGGQDAASPPLTNYRFSGIDELLYGSADSANFGEA
jgi:hypothetical protein